MSKILVLGTPGSGKTTSLGKNEKLGIKGLNPQETFIITTTSKDLSFPNSRMDYKICDLSKPPTKENGNRAVTNNGDIIVKTIYYIAESRPDIKNIVVDDRQKN